MSIGLFLLMFFFILGCSDDKFLKRDNPEKPIIVESSDFYKDTIYYYGEYLEIKEITLSQS